MKKIDKILKILEFNADKNPKGYLYTPKSKAKDYNGFTQRFIINALKDEESSIIYRKLRILLEKISTNSGF